MSECIVLGARRVDTDASKTISKGKRPPPQARQKQGVGCAVVGERMQEVQSARLLRRHGQKRSRSVDGGDPQAAKRGSRPNSKTSVHIRRVSRRDMSADLPPQMEAIHSDDD